MQYHAVAYTSTEVRTFIIEQSSLWKIKKGLTGQLPRIRALKCLIVTQSSAHFGHTAAHIQNSMAESLWETQLPLASSAIFLHNRTNVTMQLQAKIGCRMLQIFRMLLIGDAACGCPHGAVPSTLHFLMLKLCCLYLFLWWFLIALEKAHYWNLNA